MRIWIKEVSIKCEIVVQGYKEDSLYRFEVKVVGESALVTSMIDQSRLWHLVWIQILFPHLVGATILECGGVIFYI
jgi:hypothetical protein